MINMYRKISLFMLASLLCSSASAIGLSNMFLVANDSGSGLYTLFNNDSSNLYIKTKVQKVTLVDGEFVEEDYTRENFLSWDITVNPTKAVLRGQEAKDFSVKTLCGERCDRSKDSYYLVSFIPVEGEEDIDNPKMNFVYGFSAYYVIPATESHVELDASLSNDVVTVNNTGNTFVTAIIDRCNSLDNAKGCRTDFKVLAGRKFTYKVPALLLGEKLDIEFLNHDETVSRKVTLVDET
ncbi:hypothetical protein SVI_2845 [Shewanella violacea DSS12]|uniref:Uncharacterized protein n=2 Tax=Shewanella violacea TaxID=60217 RepID=D4ZMB7_SHEVD|nr:hypothetical protein SVI_2845 [Shewanella violacea DSS12]